MPLPSRRWYQLTVGRALGAAFWIGVSIAAYNLLHSWKVLDSSPQLLFAIVAMLSLSPFVAAGTLLGHPLRGLLMGIALVGAYAIAVYVAINRGWLPFP